MWKIAFLGSTILILFCATKAHIASFRAIYSVFGANSCFEAAKELFFGISNHRQNFRKSDNTVNYPVTKKFRGLLLAPNGGTVDVDRDVSTFSPADGWWYTSTSELRLITVCAQCFKAILSREKCRA